MNVGKYNVKELVMMDAIMCPRYNNYVDMKQCRNCMFYGGMAGFKKIKCLYSSVKLNKPII